jgi:hypothetical protein
MELLHLVDRVAEMSESVVRREYTDLAVAKRPACVEIGGDSATRAGRLTRNRGPS